MKKITKTIIGAALLIAAACSEKPTENGVLSFQENKGVMNANGQDAVWKVQLNTTVPFSKNTTIGIIITSKDGKAKNGEQFECPTSVTLPAGVYSTEFEIKAVYSRMEECSEYAVTLAIDPSYNTIQGNHELALTMYSSLPLVLTEFTGQGVNEFAPEGLPPIAEPLTLTLNDATSIHCIGLYESTAPDAPGHSITITFNAADGTISFPATDLHEEDIAGDGSMLMMWRIHGSLQNQNAPITGVFNTCERTIEFTAYLTLRDHLGVVGMDFPDSETAFKISLLD